MDRSADDETINDKQFLFELSANGITYDLAIDGIINKLYTTLDIDLPE